MKKIVLSSIFLGLSLSLKMNLESHQTQGHKDATPTDWKDKLSPDDYDQLIQTFSIFDEDGSGTIDAAEIAKIEEELGLDSQNPTMLKLKEINTSINFDQFLQLTKIETGTKEYYQTIFNISDKDENGLVDFEQFKSVAKMNLSLSDAQLIQLLHKTHVDHKSGGNEGFNFDQFYKIITSFKKQ